VLLDNADLALNHPSCKFTERHSGLFKIIQKMGTHTYKLALPPQWKNVNPVFNVSKLEAYREDPSNPNFPVPPPDLIDGEPEWEVEEIQDAKFTMNRLLFLVKWKGWPDSESSWEPEDNLVNSPEVIQEFYHTHPEATRQLSTREKTGVPLTKKARRKKKKGKVNEMQM